MTDYLSSEDTGQWEVTTATSRYLLDLDQRTAVRFPGEGTMDDDYYKVNRWADDDAVMHGVEIIGLEVGYPIVLLTSDGWLRSTPVRKIAKVEA